MITNLALVILIGIFATSIVVYAINPSDITRNMFIGSAIITFLYCIYLKYREVVSRGKNEPVLILSGENWHEGIIGIVAARLNYEYSMSFWFKVNGWNYRYGSQKVLLNKKNSPKIYLDNFKPRLIINQAVYDPVQESKGKTERIIIDSVPIQKWTHLFMIIRNKRVSVFINGKLVKGYVLTHMPWIQKGKMIVADELGFDGIIAHLKYFNRSATYDDVSWEYNINKPK